MSLRRVNLISYCDFPISFVFPETTPPRLLLFFASPLGHDDRYMHKKEVGFSLESYHFRTMFLHYVSIAYSKGHEMLPFTVWYFEEKRREERERERVRERERERDRESSIFFRHIRMIFSMTSLPEKSRLFYFADDICLRGRFNTRQNGVWSLLLSQTVFFLIGNFFLVWHWLIIFCTWM